MIKTFTLLLSGILLGYSWGHQTPPECKQLISLAEYEQAITAAKLSCPKPAPSPTPTQGFLTVAAPLGAPIPDTSPSPSPSPTADPEPSPTPTEKSEQEAWLDRAISGCTRQIAEWNYESCDISLEEQDMSSLPILILNLENNNLIVVDQQPLNVGKYKLKLTIKAK